MNSMEECSGTKRDKPKSEIDPRFPACVDEFVYEQCLWCSWTSKELIQRIEQNFQFRSTDIILAGYTKCGNTLFAEMAWILHQSEGAKSFDLVQEAIKRASQSTIYSRVPFLEMNYAIELGPDNRQWFPIDFLEQLPLDQTRYIKSHLPIACFEKAFLRQERADPQFQRPLVLLIARNPKDTAVSMYHFYRIADEYAQYDGSWADFLEMWLEGFIVGGDYRHVYREWARYQRRANRAPLMVATYEDCVLEPEKVLQNLCKVFARPEPRDPRNLQVIIEHTRFEKMKDNSMVNYTNFPGFNESGKFMRKGQVGDWRNWFNAEQSALFDQRYADFSQELEHFFDFTSHI